MKKINFIFFLFFVAGCFVSCCPYSVSTPGHRYGNEGYVKPHSYHPMQMELTRYDSVPANGDHFHRYLIRFPGKYSGIIGHDFMYGTIPLPNDPEWFSPGYIIHCRHFVPVRDREKK